MSSGSSELSPANPFPFEMYFNDQEICDSNNNEYAEQNEDKLKQMYRYLKRMMPEDFYATVGIIIHLGYHKIPQCQITWSTTNLCYYISKLVFSQNHFDSLLSLLLHG